MRHRILLFALAILLAATVSAPVSAAAEDSRALAASPVLVSPVNNAILRHKRPTFDWGNFPRATNYQIQVSRVRTFSSLLLNKQTASSRYVSTADLPGKAILFWRVRARVGASFTPWSNVWKFTTGNPPSIPILLTPANNAQLDDASPLFDWRNSTVPAGVTFGRYQIQVAADTAFRNILHNKNIAGIANSQDDSAVLAACSTCYWRVRAFSANGDYSAWSPVRSFTFFIISDEVIDPQDLEYLGAFRLPEGSARPQPFDYAGNTMTFNPNAIRAARRMVFPVRSSSPVTIACPMANCRMAARWPKSISPCRSIPGTWTRSTGRDSFNPSQT